MRRKPYWEAIPGIVIGGIFLSMGTKFILPQSHNFSDEPFWSVFPYIWIGIVLVILIRNIWAFFNGPSESNTASYSSNGYIKEDNHTGSADRLRELDLMRQDGTITKEEYEAKKRTILNDL